MDLTSLSSNLPRNNPSLHDDQTDSEVESSSALLMSNFKQAALTVTTLYKSAAAELDRSRKEGRLEGYNDCLDDLLTLLVKIEGRADANTTEQLRQWALSRRRKVGRPKPRKQQADRTDRDTSVESDTPTERPRSSSPPFPHGAETLPPNCRSKPSNPPPRTSLNPPQAPAFTFRSDQHLPRHVPPPPETVDVELPDTDFNSPPSSPQIIPQGGYHSRSSRSSLPPGNGHGTPRRAGNKRRFGNLNDFFDLAGVEKMHMGKKGRYF